MPANPAADITAFTEPPRSVQTVSRTGGRLLVPEQVPMWRKYVSYVDYGPNTPEYLRRWQEMLGSNMGMMWEVSEASGYEPVAVQRAVRYYIHLAQEWKRSPPDGRLLQKLQRAGIGAVATGKTADTWRVFSLPFEPMRAWMAATGERLPVCDLSPQQIEMSNVPAGDLVLADTAYPGWKVWVNGKSHRYRIFDGMFRVVTVAAPNSRMLWRYEPDTFRTGLYLSLLGSGVVTGTLVVGLLAGKPCDATE
jgi:hypothetical protein